MNIIDVLGLELKSQEKIEPEKINEYLTKKSEVNVKEDEVLGKFAKIAVDIGKLTDKKNQAYGDSFTKVGEFLKILYPEGIPVHAYTDALCIVRIFDKLMRIATDKKAFNEDPYKDIAGYALLGLAKIRQQEPESETVDPQLKLF